MDPTELALKNDGCDGRPMSRVGDWRRERAASRTGTASRSVSKQGRRPIDWDNKWHLPGTKRLPNGRMHGLGFDVGP